MGVNEILRVSRFLSQMTHKSCFCGSLLIRVVRPLKCFVDCGRFLRTTNIRERLKLEAPLKYERSAAGAGTPAPNQRTPRHRQRILALRGQVRRQNLSAAITFNTKDRNLRIVTLHEDRNGGQLRARVKGKRAAGICPVLAELERVTQ